MSVSIRFEVETEPGERIELARKLSRYAGLAGRFDAVREATVAEYYTNAPVRNAGNFDDVTMRLVQAKQRIAERYLVMWRCYCVSYSAEEMLQLALSNWLPDFLYDYDRWIVAQMLKHGVALKVYGVTPERKRGKPEIASALESIPPANFFDHAKRVLHIACMNLNIPLSVIVNATPSNYLGGGRYHE